MGSVEIGQVHDQRREAGCITFQNGLLLFQAKAALAGVRDVRLAFGNRMNERRPKL